jgi:ABC-type Fe3+-hydroxamate transport system substrate-binding protein
MRLVSLCPSLTELVFDLGRGAELVGRTRFCVHPEGLVDQVERVGGTKNPKIPRILELAPDLVLLNEEENRREDWEALEGAGIRCHVSFPRDVAGTAAMVRDIAAVLGRAAEGERIASDIEARAARVAAAAARRAPVRYTYLIWRDPWMAVSGDAFVSAMLGLAGGENVFAGAAERYPAITAEELRDAAPDRVFLSSEPFPFTATHAAELAAVTGLPLERFVLADGELLSWHGSRTARGVDYADTLLSAPRS